MKFTLGLYWSSALAGIRLFPNQMLLPDLEKWAKVMPIRYFVQKSTSSLTLWKTVWIFFTCVMFGYIGSVWLCNCGAKKSAAWKWLICFMLSCCYGENPAPTGVAISNLAKSGSGRIWKRQIWYTPNLHVDKLILKYYWGLHWFCYQTCNAVVKLSTGHGMVMLWPGK